MEPQVQFAQTKDGVSIAYYAMGDGPPFVWIELPSHLQAEWKLLPEQRRVYERLTRIGTLVRYDHRGFGLSERDISSFPLDALVSDLEAVVDRLGLTTFVLLAAGGFTGPVAIAYAAAHPERVSQLVLMAPLVRIPAPFHEQVQGLLLPGGDWRFVSESMVRLILGWEDEERSRQIAAFWREASTFDAFRASWRDAAQWDVRGMLPSVVMPTLLIHLADNPVFGPEQSREIASRMPDARVALVDGTGAERDAQYQAAFVSFLLGTNAVRPELIEQFVGNGEADGVKTVTPGGLATILFTDIVGHTEMMQRLGDDLGRAVLREHERITREALVAHGGAEVRTDGDSFMATFASVSAAVECAVALQRAFGAQNDAGHEPIVVRMGLNVGEPIEEDGDIFGSAVILGARIKDQASGGEILVPEAVRHLLSGKPFLFSDRGEVVLRGFEDAVRLYEVRWREE